MSAHVGACFFMKVKEVGMLRQGYVWIMTDGVANIVDSLDTSTINLMQGALGMKIYVTESKELNHYISRWTKRYRQAYPNEMEVEPSIYALWAYDTVWALAMAAEEVGPRGLRTRHNNSNSKGLEILGVSVNNGPKLLETIMKSNFRGISGQFRLLNGQLHSSTFQIINVVGRGAREIGFWTTKYGISRELNSNSSQTYSDSMTDLKPAIWPGDSTVVPKGWENTLNGRKLRIAVPIKEDWLQEFVKVEKDPITNAITVSGYCIDVFEAVVQKLPYAISHEYILYENAKGEMAGTYNDLVYQVYLQKYDAVVGDTTIRANRSKYVDFTLPYTESGVSMIVPVKEIGSKNAWIFLKPMTVDLWLASFAFFLFTGFVVWVMEHRINTDFRGPLTQQLGTVFYFAFSTLVFAHREKVENILSKLVVIISVFVVLILTSSYTASLSSMLTVQQLQPTVTSVQELQKNGDYVGYHTGSFVEGLLKQLKFDDSKIRGYDNDVDFVEALSRGSRNGGVAAIIHEIPYVKVFPKGSPTVPDISKGILDVTEGETMVQIEKKWFGDQNACTSKESTLSSNSFTFRSFWGLFLISGVASIFAILLLRNWHDLKAIGSSHNFICQRINAWFDYYDLKDLNFYTFKSESTA